LETEQPARKWWLTQSKAKQHQVTANMPLEKHEFIVYGRLAGAHIFKPHSSKEFTEKNDAGVMVPKERFKVTLLMNPKTAEGKVALAKVEAAMAHVAKENASKYKILKNWPIEWDDAKRFCLRDGKKCKSQKTGEIYEGFDGMMTLNMARHPERDGPPGVYDNDAENTPLSAKDGKPYNGCWVKVHGDIWVTDKGGLGMFCGLKSVKFIKDDEPLKGGGGSAPTASVYADEEEV
jgi:hypothetical protein